MTRRGIEILALLLIALGLGGCTLARVSRAWLQSREDFKACTPDPRIRCEAGSEALAARIAPLLPGAMEAIERAQYAPFAGAVVIYVHASRESFARYSGAPESAAGAVSLGVLNLSPKLLVTPERSEGILRHELSHLHLLLAMGSMLDWARLPAWFHEGLATYVSNGGGAETVPPEEAVRALREGRRFVPDASQWAVLPKNAASYGLQPHLFYREAALFIAYLHDTDAQAFEKLIAAIAARQRLDTALAAAYGAPLPVLWARFIDALPVL